MVKKLGDFAGIEVGLESPDPRLAEARELLGEIEGFMDSFEGVVVCALWSLKSRISQVVIAEEKV